MKKLFIGILALVCMNTMATELLTCTVGAATDNGEKTYQASVELADKEAGQVLEIQDGTYLDLQTHESGIVSLDFTKAGNVGGSISLSLPTSLIKKMSAEQSISFVRRMVKPYIVDCFKVVK